MEHQPATFELGMLLGILIADGRFGGDRAQPQVSLRMHVRHKPLLEWLLDRCPGSRLYGPYEHAGRSYYQFMVRGDALRYRLRPPRGGPPRAGMGSPTDARS